MRSFLITSLLASALPTLASHSHRKRDAHHRHVKRSDPDANLSERDYDVTFANGTSSHEIAKRQSYTGRGTFYYTGLGACGIYNSDSDYIVALNTPQYNEYGGGYPGPQCWKYITIQANGVTVGGVQITDECPTCDWGSLDLSPGLFTRFAPESTGVLAITWWFDGSGGGSQSTSSSAEWTPTTSSTWQAPETTTSSSQWTPSTSTTWSQTSTMSSSSSAWSAPASSANSTSSAWSSTTSLNATTNPFIVAQNYNSTTLSATSTDPAASTPTDASAAGSTGGSSSATPQAGNLVAINGLVTNYGQIVVAAAGGKST